MKNKFLFLVLFFPFAFLFSSCNLFSEYTGTSGLTFYKINDKECAVAAGDAKMREEIIIPKKYKRYTVTTIYGDSTSDEGGFAYCKNLKNIIIPDTITTIGENAFFSCTSLTSIEIPTSVTLIEERAFYNCSSLVQIKSFGSINDIEDKVFFGCSDLENITIPGSISSIGEYSFSDCSSLSNITISDGVKSIKKFAFSGCVNLKEIELPNSLETIGEYSFYDCDKIESVSYGSELKIIEKRAFDGCRSLQTMYLKSHITTIGEYAFNGCSNIILFCEPSSSPVNWAHNFYYALTSTHNYPIYWGVNKLVDNINFDNYRFSLINDELFLTDCFKKDADIIVPSSLECNGLTYDVKYIGKYSFSSYYCPNVCSIQLPNTVTTICDNAFYNSYFTQIKLSDGLKNISRSSFANCNNLNEINIPNSVEMIDSYAFNNCKNLKTIVIPNGVKTINSNAFKNCDNLTIFCESTSKPSGWHSDWNYSKRPVYWGGKWKYDEFGIPKPL